MPRLRAIWQFPSTALRNWLSLTGCHHGLINSTTHLDQIACGVFFQFSNLLIYEGTSFNVMDVVGIAQTTLQSSLAGRLEGLRL